jgi:hypothetical protein
LQGHFLNSLQYIYVVGLGIWNDGSEFKHGGDEEPCESDRHLTDSSTSYGFSVETTLGNGKQKIGRNVNIEAHGLEAREPLE